MPTLPTYVLISPVRNERDYIEMTLKSVVAQTVKPVKWVVVDDGSTDGTSEILAKWAAEYPWIEVIRMPERTERHFAGKAYAFNAGYERLKGMPFDVLGNLDADISLEPDHFEVLISKFNDNSKLGVVGAPFREGNLQYDYRFTSTDNVWGGCQMFRRECLEAVGGYKPMKGGGVDLVAVVTARMEGWETRTFPDRICIHHRVMNTAMNKGLKLKFKWGQSDYRLGSHPAWQFFRSFYQMTKPPYLVGGMSILAGYYYALITRRPKSVSRNLQSFEGRSRYND